MQNYCTKKRKSRKSSFLRVKNQKTLFQHFNGKFLINKENLLIGPPQFAIIQVLKLVYGLCFLAKRQREFGKNCIFDFKNSKNVFLTL